MKALGLGGKLLHSVVSVCSDAFIADFFRCVMSCVNNSRSNNLSDMNITVIYVPYFG